VVRVFRGIQNAFPRPSHHFRENSICRSIDRSYKNANGASASSPRLRQILPNNLGYSASIVQPTPKRVAALFKISLFASFAYFVVNNSAPSFNAPVQPGFLFARPLVIWYDRQPAMQAELGKKWLGKLTRLNPASGRGQCRGKAPHKPLLLLCLLDMAEASELPGRTFTSITNLVSHSYNGELRTKGLFA